MQWAKYCINVSAVQKQRSKIGLVFILIHAPFQKASMQLSAASFVDDMAQVLFERLDDE